jgi:hypothetical protein
MTYQIRFGHSSSGSIVRSRPLRRSKPVQSKTKANKAWVDNPLPRRESEIEP